MTSHSPTRPPSPPFSNPSSPNYCRARKHTQFHLSRPIARNRRRLPPHAPQFPLYPFSPCSPAHAQSRDPLPQPSSPSPLSPPLPPPSPPPPTMATSVPPKVSSTTPSTPGPTSVQKDKIDNTDASQNRLIVSGIHRDVTQQLLHYEFSQHFLVDDVILSRLNSLSSSIAIVKLVHTHEVPRFLMTFDNYAILGHVISVKHDPTGQLFRDFTSSPLNKNNASTSQPASSLLTSQPLTPGNSRALGTKSAAIYSASFAKPPRLIQSQQKHSHIHKQSAFREHTMPGDDVPSNTKTPQKWPESNSNTNSTHPAKVRSRFSTTQATTSQPLHSTSITPTHNAMSSERHHDNSSNPQIALQNNQNRDLATTSKSKSQTNENTVSRQSPPARNSLSTPRSLPASEPNPQPSTSAIQALHHDKLEPRQNSEAPGESSNMARNSQTHDGYSRASKRYSEMSVSPPPRPHSHSRPYTGDCVRGRSDFGYTNTSRRDFTPSNYDRYRRYRYNDYSHSRRTDDEREHWRDDIQHSYRDSYRDVGYDDWPRDRSKSYYDAQADYDRNIRRDYRRERQHDDYRKPLHSRLYDDLHGDMRDDRREYPRNTFDGRESYREDRRKFKDDDRPGSRDTRRKPRYEPQSEDGRDTYRKGQRGSSKDEQFNSRKRANEQPQRNINRDDQDANSTREPLPSKPENAGGSRRNTYRPGGDKDNWQLAQPNDLYPTGSHSRQPTELPRPSIPAWLYGKSLSLAIKNVPTHITVSCLKTYLRQFNPAKVSACGKNAFEVDFHRRRDRDSALRLRSLKIQGSEMKLEAATVKETPEPPEKAVQSQDSDGKFQKTKHDAALPGQQGTDEKPDSKNLRDGASTSRHKLDSVPQMRQSGCGVGHGQSAIEKGSHDNYRRVEGDDKMPQGSRVDVRDNHLLVSINGKGSNYEGRGISLKGKVIGNSGTNNLTVGRESSRAIEQFDQPNDKTKTSTSKNKDTSLGAEDQYDEIYKSIVNQAMEDMVTLATKREKATAVQEIVRHFDAKKKWDDAARAERRKRDGISKPSKPNDTKPTITAAMTHLDEYLKRPDEEPLRRSKQKQKMGRISKGASKKSEQNRSPESVKDTPGVGVAGVNEEIKGKESAESIVGKKKGNREKRIENKVFVKLRVKPVNGACKMPNVDREGEDIETNTTSAEGGIWSDSGRESKSGSKRKLDEINAANCSEEGSDAVVKRRRRQQEQNEKLERTCTVQLGKAREGNEEFAEGLEKKVPMAKALTGTESIKQQADAKSKRKVKVIVERVKVPLMTGEEFVQAQLAEMTEEELEEVREREGKCARTEIYHRGMKKKKQVEAAIVRPHEDAVESSRANRQQRRSFRKGINMINPKSEVLTLNMLQQRKKRVYFRKSTIHGMGLYAQEDIDAQQFVIEYIGAVIRQSVANVREREYQQEGVGDNYLFRMNAGYVVDATRRGGIARFINHSCDPNLTAKVITIRGNEHIVFYSKKAIRKHDELTYDYKFDIEDEAKKIPCLCQAANCRKYLN